MKAAWSRGKRGGGHDVSLAPFGNIPEQHVTSAAVLLIENLEMTGTEVEGMVELVVCAADFWSGKIDASGSISGVIGPDEFGNDGFEWRGPGKGVVYKGVTDNPYTNIGARRVLEYAYELTGEEKYKDKAEKIRVLYDEEEDYHPQYLDFPNHQIKTSNGNVKQADVTMMAWPWDYEYETTETLTNDLNFYASMYAPEGPGMTESITCIGYLKAGDKDKAREAFNNQLKFVQPQFNIWTETPDPTVHPSDMGCYNFLTGAGGFIQSIIHGYGGIRIRPKAVEVTLQVDEEIFESLEFENFVFRENTFTVRGGVEGVLELELKEGEGFVVEMEGNDGEGWKLDGDNKKLAIEGGVGRKVTMTCLES